MSDAELPESIRVTLTVVRLLERLGVRYAIGGSLASTVHGVVRSTMDVDIVADVRAEHIVPFLADLGDDFYGDENRALDAVARGTSFNLIEQSTVFKVDIFVAGDKRFEQSQLARRVSIAVTKGGGEHFYVLSPEDIVLAKLLWFRKGGEISDRQWNDIIGVLRVQGDRINRAYLLGQSEPLRVSDLALRAFEQVRNDT